MSATLAGVLNSYLPGGPAQNPVGGNQRNAILFSSRLRQLAFGLSTPDAAIAAAQVDRSLTQNTQTIINSTELIPSGTQNDFFKGATRILQPEIAMGINPETVEWNEPKRFTKKDTQEGSVFFHFLNSEGQNNDILTLGFSGSTGTLDPRGSLGDPSDDTGAAYNFVAWHNLYLLSREPMKLPDGSQNNFYITYASALFPMYITFTGFFNTVLKFAESGKEPNSRQYSFDFTVESVDPPLDQLADACYAAAFEPAAADVNITLVNGVIAT